MFSRLPTFVGMLLCSLLLAAVSQSALADEWRSRKKPTPTQTGPVRPARVVRAQELRIDQTDEQLEFERLDRLFGTQPESPIDFPLDGPAAPLPPMFEAPSDSRFGAPEQIDFPEMPPVPSLQDVLNGVPGTTRSGQPLTWGDDHSHRMDSVLSGPCGTEDQSFAQWWHSHSLAFRWHNQQLVRHIGQALTYDVRGAMPDFNDVRGAVRNFIDDHTLPPQIVPDVDVYDVRPRAVALGEVRTVSAEDEVRSESRIARLTRDITSIQPTLDYALKGIEPDQLPSDFFDTLDNGEFKQRDRSAMVMQWAPTNLYHYPLYFEDPALERYGHTYHPLVQPFASTGRFATQLVGLPYQMTLHPIHAQTYSLGWHRPGDFAPKKFYQIPFNEEAALMQAAVVAGLILIFP